MKYVTTCDILVDGDPHRAGDVLRTDAIGTIASMLRMKHAVPYFEPPNAPEKPAPAPEPPKPAQARAEQLKPKKVDKQAGPIS